MKECFVIMPIGTGDAYKTYRNRYEHIIEPAVQGIEVNGKQVFRCVRADFVSKAGSITRDLLTRLYSSTAVIADLTDLNPNVFYELGVRHALRSGTILIALKGTKPPFDVGDLRVITYEDRVGAEKKAIPEMQEILRSLLEPVITIDSPVLHAIPQLSELGATKEYEARINSVERERDLLRAQLDVSERTNLSSQGLLDALRKAIDNLSNQLSEPKRKETEESIESSVRESKKNIPLLQQADFQGIKVDRKQVFVLMPFAKGFEQIYEVIKEVGADAGLQILRVDEMISPGSIMDQIYESIASSGMIVADLSGRNQNVMYELGVANTMGKKTLLLAQDLDDVPFDVRMQRVLVYDLSFKKVLELKSQLKKAFMRHLQENV